MPNIELIRLLVVEDNQQRIDLFKRWIPKGFVPVFVPGAGRAMRVIELDAGTVFGGIALDFDLVEQPVIPSERMLSGGDVAMRITQLISTSVPILVHSMNIRGAFAMQNMLQAAGFSVTRQPFRDLDRDNLARWLAEVREARDEY